MSNVSYQVGVYTQLRERLSSIPDLADDEQALADTLEGATDLRETLIGIMRQADTDEALADGLDARMEQMNARRARLTARADKRKELVLWAMQESGITKIEAPDFTLSVAKTPDKVLITDESMLPADLIRTTTTTTPDKKAIGNLLKAKQEVPGATLSNSGCRLAIRRV